MSDDAHPEAGKVLADVLDAQADELARLRARIEAADKLAEAGQKLRGKLEWKMRGRNWSMTDLQVTDGWDAALSAYEGGKE